ncbi:MAG TPA: hypothetical protein PK316_21245 [Sedimentisphaerales bacterium]|nr:hypothetical protein [Sedimentisphaerales bacterium]
MPDNLIPKAKKCGNCPPLVVPRRAYTPSRPSCIECVEKHLGAAYVLLTEARDRPAPSGARQAGGYAYRLRAVGHLFEAEDEAQEWPELHATIRDARTHYQAAGEMPDWQALEGLLAAAMKTTRLETGS